MTPWETLLLAFGGNAVLLIVLAWLARSLFSQLMAKDLERFTSDLAGTSVTAAERLKHDLHLVAQEHQLVLSRLHEKRAQVIAEAYGLLVEAHWAAQELVSLVDWAGEPSKKEKYGIAMAKAAEFYRFFDRNRIYLPVEACGSIDALVQAMRTKVIAFGVYLRREESSMLDETLEKKYQAWQEAAEYFASEIPKARAALEQELRAIIGVKSAG
jgi:hypothetical protein